MNGASHRAGLVVATRTVILAAVGTAWELLPRIGVVDRLSVVPLTTALDQAISLLGSGDLLSDLWATGSMMLIAFAIATGVGIVAGFVLWKFGVLGRLIRPYLSSYYALPIIVFYPTLIAIFGLNRTPVVVIAAGWAVVAVTLAVMNGLSSVPDVMHQTAAVYRMSVPQRMLRIYVPVSAPLLFNGLRLAAGYSMIGVIASEFVLAPGGGLGYAIKYYYNNFQIERMYGVIIVIIVLAMTVTSLLSLCQRKLFADR